MCKAIDELERRAREEGIALGEKRGEALGIERGIEMFILDNLEEEYYRLKFLVDKVFEENSQ